MNTILQKKDFLGQFILSCLILLSFILNFLEIVDGIFIWGLFLFHIIGIWQVISAIYNTMSCENLFLKKGLKIYWGLAVPAIIISLLQYAELLKANNIIMIGTLLFSAVICSFYLYIQYVFLYKNP